MRLGHVTSSANASSGREPQESDGGIGEKHNNYQMKQLESKEYKGVKSHKCSDRDWDWQGDYFAWCIYVRTGCTQTFVAAICGITVSRVINILEWAMFWMTR